MRPDSLEVPFLLGASETRPGQINFEPTHIATWSTPSEAGPSKRIALAAPDNTIWVYPDPSFLDNGSVDPPPPPSAPLPRIRATSPTPTGTPKASRPNNPRVASFSNRSRAPSNASSTRTTSSRRRVTTFSPPASAQPVTASISPTTATVAAADSHGRSNSLSERAELLDHLREQQARNSEEGRSGVGLGLNLGRKLDVHGQADHEKVSGTTSPKSVKSLESQRTSIGGRLMGWAKGTESEEQKLQEELDEQVAEIAVEREMAVETEKDARQEEDMKVVEQAIARASPTNTPPLQASESSPRAAVRRIVLRRPGQGKIVDMQVCRGLGLLCVLRDVGLVDVFRLMSLEQTTAADLDEVVQQGAASSSRQTPRLSPFWQWRGFCQTTVHTTPLLAFQGLPWPCGLQNHNGDVTRVILLSITSEGASKIEASLDLPGQGSIGLCRINNETHLLHSTQTSLTSYPVQRESGQNTEQPNRPSSGLGIKQNRAISSAHSSPRQHLQAPGAETDQPLLRKNRSVASLRDHQQSSTSDNNSFAKFLAAKKADWRGEKAQEADEKPADSIRLGEGREVERDGGGSWDRISLQANGEGVGMVQDAVDVFAFDGTKLRIRETVTLEPSDTVRDALLQSGTLFIVAKNKVIRCTMAGTDSPGADASRHEVIIENVTALVGDGHKARPLVVFKQGIGRLDVDGAGAVETVLVASSGYKAAEAQVRVTPSVGGRVWTSDGNGDVHQRSLTGVLQATQTVSDHLDADRLASPVTCMRVVQASKRYLIAGDEDGAIRIWDDMDGQLLASWTVFADAVNSIAYIAADTASVLSDHLLCASLDGTIGVISAAELEHLFLIPASRGPLRRVFVSGKDVMLAYANGKARLWNVETMEFRRSTGLDAADEMLTSGDWHEVDFDDYRPLASSSLGSLSARAPSVSEIGRALSCDLRKVSAELRQLPTPYGLAMLSGLLSAFVTCGVDSTIDQVCFEHLGIVKPQDRLLFGTQSRYGSTVLSCASGLPAWQLSPQETGLRQLVILTLLRPFLDSPEHEQYAAQVIAYYATGLPDCTTPADLNYFTDFYLDRSGDVQQAARMLFNSALDRMTESDLQSLVAEHQSRLPAITDKYSIAIDAESAHSLLMIGAIALHKYQSVNPATLKSVAEAILSLLSDPSSPHLELAVELCSKGYTTWQTFVDPMELLRRLFSLSTRKDASTINAQARLAVLHVASSNPALFMSTLSMDILDAQSAEGRTSIMKLCVFMARKKPEVLENGLPRIAEAVVKSLDPNIGKMREDVWQAATVILNELVLAFSTIDFHSGTQKLAVGTHEGAVIMYELKTASRLYVLEPHRGPVSSVTFSPDGRRLLTVSLEEGAVTVWKVGSSLSGFFNVGGPPRQGALGGSGPFKRIEFARVGDSPLKSTSALSDVHVTWPGPRQAKVMIGETAMSFET